MCTALSLESKDGHHFFGRTMDLPYEFQQSPIQVPRNYTINNPVTGENWNNKYGILGMGMVEEGHPFLAEGMNEQGLACAGLNFPHFAIYQDSEKSGAENMPPYDFMLWMLGNFSTVAQVREVVQNVHLVGKAFSPELPLPTLHWMVYDKSGDCIVIEPCESGLNVFKNKVGVLANSPTFDWHITNLNQFAGLSSEQTKSVQWHKQTLAPQADGLGLRGLPGDCYSSSRFVRMAFLRSHVTDLETKESTLAIFFHCLDMVSMVAGTVLTESGAVDQTIYCSTMDLDEGVYYYKTKTNSRISAVSFTQQDLSALEVSVFPYESEQSIDWLN